MTGNVLVYIFFGLFFLFLAESIYFLKKKLSVGVVEATNPEKSQNSGKAVLAAGLAVVALLVVSFGWFFLSKQSNTSQNTVSKTAPTAIPTLIPSPIPNQTVYNFPTITGILPSPTLAMIVTTNPTKSPAKTPTPTKIPTATVTLKPKAPTPTPTIKSAIGGPASPGQGGPETVSPTISPTKNEATSSGIVVVPKMPIAGSIQYTLIAILIGISSVALGIIL